MQSITNFRCAERLIYNVHAFTQLVGIMPIE